MSFIADRLNLRCFIDGIEIPVIGARCTFSDNAPAVAEVQIVATDEIFDFKPRSAVHLFTYDSSAYEPGLGTVFQNYIGVTDLRRWKLMYAGEFAGIGFQKQSGQRMGILNCITPDNYWDFVKQHYVNFRNGGIEQFENAFMGVDLSRQQFFDVFAAGVHSNIIKWLNESEVTYEDKDGEKVTAPSLYRGVQKMLRQMFFSANDFYATAFCRWRMHRLVVGVPEDTTSAKLMKLKFFTKLISQRLGGAGGMVSARQMVGMILGMVFHNYVVVPFPKFDIQGEALDPGVRELSKPAEDRDLDDPLYDEIAEPSTYRDSSLNMVIIKPDAWFLAPPVCNVIFPHMYSSVAFQRNYLQEPTRLFLRTSLIFSSNNKWLTERFYAPDFESVNPLIYQSGDRLRRLSETVLPHEEFVGINPAAVWQSDLQAYVQKGARREYMARVADYMFWKLRFAQRTINVSGPFNPELVAGYPGVVFDRMHMDVVRVDADGTPVYKQNRHLVGHVQTIVHAIDQRGGWTHATLVGARVHDEDVDFDGEGRGLEEVTSRGTDGFLDDRYDFERIGKEVYQPLLGCDSIIDPLSDYDVEADATFTMGSATPAKNVRYALWRIQVLYRRAIDSGADLHEFTRVLTGRPKANLVQLFGYDEGDETVSPIYARDGMPSAGFWDFLTNGDSSEFAENDTYLAHADRPVRKKRVVKEATTEVTEHTVANRSYTIEVETPEVVEVYYVNVDTTTESSYDLQGHLQARQECVLKYLASIEQRGLRG